MKASDPVTRWTHRAAGLFVLAALLLAPTRGAAAQGSATPPAIDADAVADRMVTAMADQLSLSEEQQTQVRPIFVTAVEEQQALLEEYRQQEGDASPQDLRDDLQEVQEEADQNLSDVLSEEQMQQYTQMRKEQAQQRRQRRQQAQRPQQGAQQGQQQAPANPIDRVLTQFGEQLNLTEEQKNELRPILEEQAQQMRAMQQEMQGADADARSEHMEEMRAMQQETSERIEAILDAEQVEAFRALQEQQRQAMEQRRQQMQEQMQERQGTEADTTGGY